MSWLAICPLEDIPPLGARVVAGPNGDIAVFRTADDCVFALRDQCPHKGGPLSQGIVHGERVTCPLHNWVIDLQSGEATGADSGCTHAFPIRVTDGQVWLDFSGATGDAADHAAAAPVACREAG